MNRQDDHEKRVGGFPAHVQEAHTHSANHREEVLSSTRCGCFYCLAMFPPSDIVEWIDEDERGIGQTAMCPRCGIDSVIGDASGHEIAREWLSTMKYYWFSS